MKIDLRKFSVNLLKDKRLLFVYGNLSELADALCDELTASYGENEKFKLKVLSAADFLKSQDHDQCELYSQGTNVYRIKNVTDHNAESVINIAFDDTSSIFIATPGDYKSSKNVGNIFCDNSSWLAIPSFKNDLGYKSICGYFFKNLSSRECSKIAEVLESSDESIASIILKLSLLCECDKRDIENYTTQSNNWIFDMSPIAILRMISSSYIKYGAPKTSENLYKKNDAIKAKNVLEYCLNSELQIKNGYKISNDMILNDLLLEQS